MTWLKAAPLTKLASKGRLVARLQGRQILLIQTAGGIVACPNRCPHEGYPLSEGLLGDDCVLTCNWHNWKFDLASGETLVGGDRLRRFPVRVTDGHVEVELAPPDPAVERERAIAGLETALVDIDQGRLVRETARLTLAGFDGAEAVATAVGWAAERLEFGATHALAGAPDWLALHDRKTSSPDERLVAIGEILGHIAEDARVAGAFPFATDQRPWNEAAFLAAIEAEDEAAAVALLRGALAAGMGSHDLAPALNRAALTHYADFGHSLIYAVKTVKLADRLGAAATWPLLALLVRSLVYARREDLLPEFRSYAAERAVWGRCEAATKTPSQAALRGLSAKSAMGVVRGWSANHAPWVIFSALVDRAAACLLNADADRFDRTDGAIADNVGWLDFTHALTFADAGREAALQDPALWPDVLLQLACFVGRNAGLLDPDLDVRAFAVADPRSFAEVESRALFDHGRERFIISVHLIKTLFAGLALVEALPERAPGILSALNRFLHAPIKGRHTLRTARQMRAFVAQA